MQSLSGTAVAIQGVIIPAGRPDLTFCRRSRVASIGHEGGEAPGGQEETVDVFAARADQVTDDPLRVSTVRGVFEAGLQRDAVYELSLFRIRQARVEEAVGATIMKVGEPSAPASHP